MAHNEGARDYERHQLDTIYQAGSDVASQLRRMAEDIDRAVANAKKNEGTEDNFQSTYLNLPHQIQSIVHWGIANSSMERITRLVSDLVAAREKISRHDAASIIERLQEFSRVWAERPQNGDKIYSLGYMTGPDDARVEAEAVIDLPLLNQIIDLLPKKAS